MREILKKFEGTKITFEYSGPDHPNGKIGTQKVTGKVIKIGIDTFKIDLYKYKDIELSINDIVEESIKKTYR